MTKYIYSWWNSDDCTENDNSMHTSPFKLNDGCVGMDGLVEVFNITKDGDTFNVQSCEPDDDGKCGSCDDHITLYPNKCMFGESITTEDNRKIDSPNIYPTTINYYSDFSSPPIASKFIEPDGKCNSVTLSTNPSLYTHVRIPYYIKNDTDEGNLLISCRATDDEKSGCYPTEGCAAVLAKNKEKIIDNRGNNIILNNSSYHCDKKTGTCNLHDGVDGYRTKEECDDNCNSSSSHKTLLIILLIVLVIIVPLMIWGGYKWYKRSRSQNIHGQTST